MILQNIDKATYRKNLNILIAVTIVALLVIAIGSSTVLIHLIGEPGGSNFVLNVVGVCCAVAVVASVFYRIRTESYMREIWYVWRLKQELNAIYRHSKVLKQALENNQPQALIVAYYNLNASIQVYELDDNTLTINELKKELSVVEEKIQSLGMEVTTEDYHRDLLKELKGS